MECDIKKIQSIHFVGIAGVAMTALAVYAKERGIRVTGSDVAGTFPTNEILKKAGITTLSGFSPDHVVFGGIPELVIYTGAHQGIHNLEVAAAIKQSIPVVSHGEALGCFMNGMSAISVAGSHGKTTASAMIATIMKVAGADPSYAIGCGEIRGLGMPGHYGTGSLFIAEADEYVTDPHHDKTPRFLWQHPDTLVVTNIDYDHPDVYASLEEVQHAFVNLQKQCIGKRIIILNADDRASAVLDNSATGIVRFGFSPRSDMQVTHVGYGQERTFFSVSLHGTSVGEFVLHVPGIHNVVNATAAIACCVSYGISFDAIREGLDQFGGTKRRAELIGTTKGITLYDDYAHHPKEIQATLQGLRSWYPNKRIITIFQPHTYSRTKALLEQFAQSFSQSDVVLCPDIFASAREVDTLGMTSGILVEEIAKHHRDVRYVKDYQGAVQSLKNIASPGDIIVCMGAGDIFEWSTQLLSDLS